VLSCNIAKPKKPNPGLAVDQKEELRGDFFCKGREDKSCKRAFPNADRKPDS
jgi:hypothetical protein